MYGDYSAPFASLSPAVRTSLTADRLKAGSQVLGNMSTVAYLDGPAGHLLLYMGGESVRMYIKGRYVTTASGAGDVEINLHSLGYRVVRTLRSAPAFPTASHPDLLAYTSTDGGKTWQPAVIKNANFDAGTLTVTAPSACDIAIYYVVGDGTYELRISRPMGGDSTRARLIDGALRSIHETDQTNIRSAPVFGSVGREYPQPPQFRLELAVNSNSAIVWDSYAQHELALPVWDGAIEVYDAARMAAMAEVVLRGGSI